MGEEVRCERHYRVGGVEAPLSWHACSDRSIVLGAKNGRLVKASGVAACTNTRAGAAHSASHDILHPCCPSIRLLIVVVKSIQKHSPVHRSRHYSSVYLTFHQSPPQSHLPPSQSHQHQHCPSCLPPPTDISSSRTLKSQWILHAPTWSPAMAKPTAPTRTQVPLASGRPTAVS